MPASGSRQQSHFPAKTDLPVPQILIAHRLCQQRRTSASDIDVDKSIQDGSRSSAKERHHCRPQCWPRMSTPPHRTNARYLDHNGTKTGHLLLTTFPAPQKVTPRQSKPRVSRMKGHLSKRTAFVRDVVKEVAGYVCNSGVHSRTKSRTALFTTTPPFRILTSYSLAPYERRVIELLRNSKDKRARKLAKKRLGTFGRAKRKVDEMTNVIAQAKRA